MILREDFELSSLWLVSSSVRPLPLDIAAGRREAGGLMPVGRIFSSSNDPRSILIAEINKR